MTTIWNFAKAAASSSSISCDDWIVANDNESLARNPARVDAIERLAAAATILKLQSTKERVRMTKIHMKWSMSRRSNAGLVSCASPFLTQWMCFHNNHLTNVFQVPILILFDVNCIHLVMSQTQKQKQTQALRMQQSSLVQQTSLVQQSYPQKPNVGTGASGTVRSYGRKSDMNDNIWGFAYSTNHLQLLQDPQYHLQQSADSFFKANPHLFIHFDKPFANTKALVVKMYSRELAVSDVVGHMIAFDRFKNDISLTSLLQTPDGNCPCLVVNNGSIKGVLMRGLVPFTTEIISEIRSTYSYHEKFLVYLPVWRFVSTMWTMISGTWCVSHGDMFPGMGNRGPLSDNVLFDPIARNLIVVDYDTMHFTDISVRYCIAEDDLFQGKSLFEKYARHVHLDINSPKPSSVQQPMHLDQMDLFIHLQCIFLAKESLESSFEPRHRLKWFKLLRLLFKSVANDSGCINIRPVFDKMVLEIQLGDQTVLEVQTSTIINCRLLLLTLFFYFKILQSSDECDTTSKRLILHVLPDRSEIVISFVGCQRVIRNSAIIEVLMGALTQNSNIQSHRNNSVRIM